MSTAGETLSVVIGAQTDPLIQGLKQAEAALNSFGRTTQTAMSQVASAAGSLETLFGVGLSGGLAYLIKNTINSVGALKEQADQLGINVEKFQALNFAAVQSGVSSDDFTQGLNRLSRQLGEAQSGVLKSQDIFAKWGIAVRDQNGNALNLEQVLAELSNRFQSITDPQLRSAAAMDLMGRSAFNMINFLSQGSSAMATAEQRAQQMGAVIGTDTVEKMKAAKDQIEATSAIVKVNLTEAIQNVLPLIKLMSDGINMLSDAGHGATLIYSALANQIKSIFNGGGNPAQTFYDTMKQMDQKNPGLLSPLQGNSGAGASPSQSSGSGFTPGNPAAARALDDYLKKLQNLHDLTSLTARDQAVQAAVDQAETIARSQNVKVTDDYIQAVKDAAGANYDLQQQVQELNQVSKEFSSDFINQFNQMAQGAETFGQALRNLGLDIVNLIEKMLIQKPLENAFSDMLGGAGGAGGILGALGGLLGLGGGDGGGLEDLGGVGNALDAGGMPTFGGFFAAGGSPPTNVPSMVGENGPELFIPRSAGTVVPNNALGGNTVHLTQNVNFSTGVVATVRAEVMNMLPQIADASKAAVADSFKRGGRFAHAMGG